jgi:uncharacterized RDD family membrane protein YckC
MRLDSELIVETPEHVELRFALASVGTRFLAALIDHAIQLVVMVATLLLLAQISSLFQGIGPGKSVSMWAFAAFGLIVFVVYFGYFSFFETMWNGQTPGKRWMRLRVIREDGRPITFFEAFVRNILRTMDFAPSGYAIGVVTVILSPEARRIGDYVAGTVVIKERASETPSLDQVLDFHAQEVRRGAYNNPGAVKLDVRKLTRDEIAAVERFLSRREELPAMARPWMAARISGTVAHKLNIPAVYNHEAFLEDVDRQYRAQAKYFVD